MGELGLATEAAVAHVTLFRAASTIFSNSSGPGLPARPVKLSFCSMASITRAGGLVHLGAAVLECLRHGEQDALEAGATVTIFRREVGAAEVGLAIGSEKRGERPAALSADGGDGGLVARIDVGPLVAIHFYGDEVFIDDAGGRRVFVRLAIHDVAPVAPDGSDVEQDWLIFAYGAVERRLPPLHPVHWLMPCGAKVRRGCFRQQVHLFEPCISIRSAFVLMLLQLSSAVRCHTFGYPRGLSAGSFCRPSDCRAAACGSPIQRKFHGCHLPTSNLHVSIR